MVTKWRVWAGVAMCVCATGARAQTVETNTFAEINQMATMWEGNPSQITSLVNTQYPAYNGDTWEYIFPVSRFESDGDIHIDMAVNSSGSGSTGNNEGESPIICEVVNASNAMFSSDLTYLNNNNGAEALPVGIFRFWTEHQYERHFEFHPMIGLLQWNASSNAFVSVADYHNTITNDDQGTTHAIGTLEEVFNGEDQMTATVLPDNNHLAFTWQSPSVNYVQYGGTALSGLTNDFVSGFFWFKPTSGYAYDGQMSLSFPVAVRCRIITNTYAGIVGQDCNPIRR